MIHRSLTDLDPFTLVVVGSKFLFRFNVIFKMTKTSSFLFITPNGSDKTYAYFGQKILRKEKDSFRSQFPLFSIFGLSFDVILLFLNSTLDVVDKIIYTKVCVM